MCLKIYIKHEVLSEIHKMPPFASLASILSCVQFQHVVTSRSKIAQKSCFMYFYCFWFLGQSFMFFRHHHILSINEKKLAKSICTTIDYVDGVKCRFISWETSKKFNFFFHFRLLFFHPRTHKRRGLLRTFHRPKKLSMEICYGNEKLE